ncbi:polyketide synthase dehydratase domain-containing protein, partial [Streptosporangium album]|uniref:polyketide synthase dehydratase domain-containing protein n=1 Tax=Streptosporangium album TaxID=47479 RepID=UPI0031EA1935
MVAIAAAEDEVTAFLTGQVGIAAVNGPASVVVSGEEEAVLAVASRFERTKRLKVSHAFHSPLMEPMLAEFALVAESVSYASPAVPVVSNVTGEPVEAFSAEYWVRHVREAVRFCDAVRFLESRKVSRFVEVGPDAVLSAMGAECLADPDAAVFVPVLRRGRPEARELLSALGRVYASGAEVDWAAFFAGSGARRVDLPTYAFQRERYWLDAPAVRGDVTAAGLAAAGHPLLSAVVALPGSDGVVLTGRLSVETHPWLADHDVLGTVLLPGTAFVELAIRAGDEVGCDLLEELTLEAPLVVPERGGMAIRVEVAAGDEAGRRPVEVYSRPGDASPEEAWTRNARGFLVTGRPVAPFDLTEWPPPGAAPVALDGAYERLLSQGYDYGQVFRGLKAAWRRGDEVFAEVALPEGTSADGFGLHPALLDAALHADLLTDDGQEQTLLPFVWSGVSLYAAGASVVRVRISGAGSDTLSLEIADAAGVPVASVGSLVSRPVAAEQLRVAGRGDGLFRVEWRPSVGGRMVSGSCVLVGEDAFGLSVLPEVVGVYADLAALAAGTAVPDVMFFSGLGEPGEDVPAAVRSVTGRVLAVVQEWLAGERFAASKLVVVTRGAVSVAGEDVTDLAGAAVWGLIRAAQEENPGRFVLADLDGQGPQTETVLAAVAAGEPELAVRDGEVVVPRLAKAVVQGQASPWSAEGTVLV